MDDNKVSMIAVDIIHVAYIDICQNLHDVIGQLDKRTSTSFQINSLNLRMKTNFHKMVAARFRDLHRV